MRRQNLNRLGLAAAILAFAPLAYVPTADAQTSGVRRAPLVITVPPRSYFDAGKVVAVGTYTRYVSAGTTSAVIEPLINRRDQFGEGRLPDRSVGPSPYGSVDYSPFERAVFGPLARN